MIALWQPFLDVVSDMAREATAHDRARPLMSRLSNVGFYVSTIAFGAFPYSLVYPLAIYDVLYGTTGRRDDADSAALARERLGWCVMALFLLAVLLFYLAVSKHHRWYVMPAYPLLSLFLARFVVGLGSRRPSLPLLASIALVVGLLALTMVNLGYNPFNLKSWSIPMTLYWRRPPGVPPLLALPLLSGLLLALLLWLRQRRGERLPGLLAVAFATLLPLYGALRVAEPLRHLDHQSEMAALRSELDALERSGVVLDYPIEPAVPIGWDARYYLGDRYRIEVRADRTFLLHPGRSDAAPPESTRGD